MKKELLETIEELKETIKKEIKRDYFKKHEDLKILFSEYKDNQEELHKIIEEREKQEKQEKQQEEKRKLKECILIDNLYYITHHYIFEDIKTIFNKYITKNIGDKTRDKIQNEIEEFIKNKYNIDISIYIRRDIWIRSYEYQISLHYNDFEHEYQVNDNIKITYRIEDNNYSYYRTQLNFIELDKINSYINRIMKEKKEIEEKQEEIEKLKSEFNSNMGGKLYSYNRIK